MSDEIRVLSTYSTVRQTLYNLMSASMHLDGDNAEPLPYGSRLVLVRGELADRIRALEAREKKLADDLEIKNAALKQLQAERFTQKEWDRLVEKLEKAEARAKELEDALGTNRVCANCTGGLHTLCAGRLRCNCGCYASKNYEPGNK